MKVFVLELLLLLWDGGNDYLSVRARVELMTG